MCEQSEERIQDLYERLNSALCGQQATESELLSKADWLEKELVEMSEMCVLVTWLFFMLASNAMQPSLCITQEHVVELEDMLAREKRDKEECAKEIKVLQVRTM
jgi:hypothetical protein